MKTPWARGWRWLGAGLLLVFCAAVAAAGFVLGTVPGRQWLAEGVSQALSSDSLAVRVEGIRVVWPINVAIDSVQVADPDGTWLKIRDVRGRWVPLALLEGRIQIRTLQFGTLDLARLPAGDEAKSTEAPPSLPEFVAERAEIGQVWLASAVCGFPVELSELHGRVEGGMVSNGAVRIGIDAQAARAMLDKTNGEELAGDIELGFASNRWAVSGALAGDGFRVAGELEFPDYGTWPAGRLQAEADGSTEPVGDLWPGLSAGRFSFSWDCPPRTDGIELAQANLSVAGLQAGESGIQSATMQAQLRRSPAQPEFSIEASAHLENFSLAKLAVTGAEFHIAGPWGSFDVTGKFQGVFEKPFVLEATGRLQWEGEGREVELSQISANWAGAQARLMEPLWIQMQGNQFSIRGAAKLEPFDLSSVSGAVSGNLDGRIAAELRVGGTLAAPIFEGEVSCNQLAARVDAWDQLPPVDGSCRFDFSNGMLRASAQAGAATNGFIRLKAQVPAQASFLPWKLNLDRDRDLSIALDAGLDLAVLNGLDAFANGRIGGRIDLSMAHVGSLSSGSVTGACVLASGEYENYSLGTVIREARLRLVSSGKTLLIESGSATDGGRGRVTLSGNLRPDPAAGLPYELEIDCRQMRLLRRPDAEATVSGQLALDGTVSRLHAAGDWQIDNAVVDLRNLRPPPPAELEPVQAALPAKAKRDLDHDAFALRLAVSIPGSLYVRSGMLDTAWAGNLVLAHERGKPGLSGYLEPRRGTVLLLKRPFKLDEGRIDFDGRWPPEPLLRLTAVYARSDLSARARITGPARDPDVSLTSEPPLPEDEILARILFGESMSSLTPLQAISLASEASKLRNITGGGGVLDGVQAALGIDRVEFRENGQDSGAAEVAVGKYLGDRSYIEMRRAATMDSTQGTRIFLEHDLRPNIVLEAESGLEMRSGIGLFWKRDY